MALWQGFGYGSVCGPPGRHWSMPTHAVTSYALYTHPESLV